MHYNSSKTDIENLTKKINLFENSKSSSHIQEFTDNIKIQEELIKTLKEELKEEFKKELQETLKEELQERFKNQLKEELQETLKKELQETLKNQLKEELQGTLKEELQETLTNQLKEELQKTLKEELQETLKTTEIDNSGSMVKYIEPSIEKTELFKEVFDKVEIMLSSKLVDMNKHVVDFIRTNAGELVFSNKTFCGKIENWIQSQISAYINKNKI